MRMRKNIILMAAGLAPLALALGGCGSGLFGQTGPSAGVVNKAPQRASAAGLAGIRIVDLDRAATEALLAIDRPVNLAREFGDALPVGSVVQPGDVLEVSIWEAPPAALFGGGFGSGGRSADAGMASTTATLPELLVGTGGTIFVPFAGTLPVSGHTPQQIEADITRRLASKAHLPQIIVRIVRNATANATVVGDVANAARVALTPKGERLLDALAAAGGTRQPSGKTTIQITRGDKVAAVPLDQIIRQPDQNIRLATGDVVTAIFQPFSYTVLGAAGRNQEVQFESTGLTLSQALGRAGGLQEQRANAKGLFIFRWEVLTAAAAGAGAPATPTDAKGRVPVIYRVNMLDPAVFFLAQNFQMRDGDVLYVATAPVAEFQQFVNVIASTVLPLAVVRSSLQ